MTYSFFISLLLITQPLTEVGMASYYANKFHGRKTASGELYDKNKYTAAHRTLPFGTLVWVKNLKTLDSVIVRVNDRGPHVKGRVIDLSYIAATDLKMITAGKVKVSVNKAEGYVYRGGVIVKESAE